MLHNSLNFSLPFIMYVFINLRGALFFLLGNPEEQSCLSAGLGGVRCRGCSFAFWPHLVSRLVSKVVPEEILFYFFPNQQHMEAFVSRKIIPGEEKVARGQLHSVVLCFLF